MTDTIRVTKNSDELLIQVLRLFETNDETIGLLSIDGQPFCFTLEDEYREDKISGETRIPAGRYPVVKRTVGGFFERYKRRFGSWHGYMLEVLGVPGFTDILFHCGNTDEDTSGCILVGDIADINRGLPGMTIGRSANAYVRFYQVVKQAIDAGRPVVLEIVNAN